MGRPKRAAKALNKQRCEQQQKLIERNIYRFAVHPQVEFCPPDTSVDSYHTLYILTHGAGRVGHHPAEGILRPLDAGISVQEKLKDTR